MISRRQFLTTLGISGAAVGAGLLKFPLIAEESSSGLAPKRLLMISTTHGWVYEGWKMRSGDKPEDKSWDFALNDLSEEEFSPSLKPLYRHRNKLLLPDGLSLGTCELDIEGYRHAKGWLQAWTGDFAYFNGKVMAANSASLDQLVAKQIARSDRFQSIEIDVYGAEPGRPVCHAGKALPLPLERSPEKLWQRMLGPSVSGDKNILSQGSALDFAKSEYDLISSKISKKDKEKLDIHFDLIRTLEKRIRGISEISCDAGPKPDASLESYEARLEAFVNLIATSFSCDLSRVATLSLGEMAPKMFGYDEFKEDATHKGIAHNVYDDPSAALGMTACAAKHAEQIAGIVDILSAIPDVDGRTLMDNTLIVWGSELADGWHGYRHYCPLIIGGDWHFKTGRYLYWPHETPIEVLSPTEERILISGKPHQQFLVSCANAMGVDTSQVGIGIVQAQNGAKVDCRGPLPDLT